MKKKINWEERRFIASAIILGGMYSNFYNSVYQSSLVRDAVALADKLIDRLNQADEEK